MSDFCAIFSYRMQKQHSSILFYSIQFNSIWFNSCLSSHIAVVIEYWLGLLGLSPANVLLHHLHFMRAIIGNGNFSFLYYFHHRTWKTRNKFKLMHNANLMEQNPNVDPFDVCSCHLHLTVFDAKWTITNF